MATKKRQIAFYADDVVADWYAALAPGEGTRRINDYLHKMIAEESTIESQVTAINEELKVQQQRVATLASHQHYDANTIGGLIDAVSRLVKQQRRIYASARSGSVQEIEEEYDNIERIIETTKIHYATRDI